MQLRVLGCHGGETSTHRATAFLIDDTLAMDAGSLARGLSLDEQVAIDHVLITHSHLDHVRDLALLADNIINVKKKPLYIHCVEETANVLKTHLFNDLLWPDFTTIINPAIPEKLPTIVIKQLKPNDTVHVGRYRVTPVPVSHSVPCHGMMVDDGDATLAYSGDTGPTEKFYEALNACKNLRGFITEVSFPNDMKWLADVSGHLTPEMLRQELRKFSPLNPNTPVFIYHFKPGSDDVLIEQLRALKDRRIRVLKPMDEFNL